MALSLVDLDRYESHSLFTFAKLAWPIVEPAPFQANWHHEVVCEHLTAVSALQIRNLVINQPPGTSKSLLVNVFWPVWEWLTRPRTKWIYFSFDRNLVGQRDGGKMITLLQSRWFVERWGNLLVDKNPSAANFDNVKGGFRYSSSPGAGGTGRHGNIVVVDDPSKPPAADQKSTITLAQLRRVSGWWGARAVSRRADPSTHREVLVMQRIHHADLASEFIRAGWTHLNFPMRFERAYSCPADRRTVDGELLHPARFPESAVQALEVSMGPTIASAQLQQRPHVAGGKIFKRSYWRFWHNAPGVPEPCLCDTCFDAQRSVHVTDRMCRELPKSGFDFTSWDCAFKKTDDSDYVAGGAWRIAQDYFLMRLWNERLSYSETRMTILHAAHSFRSATVHLIEEKANGSAILDDLRHDVSGLEGVEPEGGKEARAHAAEGPLASLRVFLPHPDLDPLSWVLMAQAEAFPNDVHDDLVDMLSQAIIWARSQGYDAMDQAMKVWLRGRA